MITNISTKAQTSQGAGKELSEAAIAAKIKYRDRYIKECAIATPLIGQKGERAIAGCGFVDDASTRNSKKAEHYRTGVERCKRWLASVNAIHPDDATESNVNDLLLDAEDEDRANAESLVEPNYRGFEPYSLRLRKRQFFAVEKGGLTSEEIYTIGEDSYVDENKIDTLVEGYTVQTDRSPDFLEFEDARDLEQHNMIMDLTGLSKGMLFAIAALGNQIIHRAAASTGLLQRNGKGETCVSGPSAAMRFAKSRHRVWNPINATVGAAAQFWSDVKISGSRSSIRRVADWLRDRCYVNFEGDFKEGVWGKGREYFGIDMTRLLMLLECVERLLGGYKAMPRHRMSFVQKLFNAVFEGRRYGRSPASDCDLAYRDDHWSAAHSPRSGESYAEYSRSQSSEAVLFAAYERAVAEYGEIDERAETAYREYEDADRNL